MLECMLFALHDLHRFVCGVHYDVHRARGRSCCGSSTRCSAGSAAARTWSSRARRTAAAVAYSRDTSQGLGVGGCARCAGSVEITSGYRVYSSLAFASFASRKMRNEHTQTSPFSPPLRPGYLCQPWKPGALLEARCDVRVSRGFVERLSKRS